MLRSWQDERPLQISQLMYPIFVTDKKDSLDEIKSLPEQYQISIDRLESFIAPLIAKGLPSVIVFGVLTEKADTNGNPKKDAYGSHALRFVSQMCKYS